MEEKTVTLGILVGMFIVGIIIGGLLGVSIVSGAINERALERGVAMHNPKSGDIEYLEEGLNYVITGVEK